MSEKYDNDALDALKIQDKESFKENAEKIAANISPIDFINSIKDNMLDAEFSFMNGDCGVLAISLDLIYGDENSSFAILHTSRGDADEDEEDENNYDMEEDKDSDEDFLWRLSTYGEMKHILWKDSDGKYYDILGKYGSVAESIEESIDFYDQYNLPELDLDATEFGPQTVSKETIYSNIMKGTRNTYNSPEELIETISNSIDDTLANRKRMKI